MAFIQIYPLELPTWRDLDPGVEFVFKDGANDNRVRIYLDAKKARAVGEELIERARAMEAKSGNSGSARLEGELGRREAMGGRA
jgi:hypothetical protein